jgi:membrane protease YdiL (CAAX protease family)
MKELKNEFQTKTVIVGILILIVFDFLFELFLISTRDMIVIDSYLLIGIYQQLIMFVTGVILTLVFFKSIPYQIFKGLKDNLKYVFYFALLFPIGLALVYLLVYLFDTQTWITLTNYQISDISRLRDTVIFQSVFPGLGEEVLFRGFGLVLLLNGYFIYGKKVSKNKVFGSLILISLIFSIAHVSYRFNPFSITYDSYQLFTALILGMIEGYAFYKSRNIIVPILIHNISNLMLTFAPLLIGYLF